MTFLLVVGVLITSIIGIRKCNSTYRKVKRQELPQTTTSRTANSTTSPLSSQKAHDPTAISSQSSNPTDTPTTSPAIVNTTITMPSINITAPITLSVIKNSTSSNGANVDRVDIGHADFEIRPPGKFPERFKADAADGKEALLTVEGEPESINTN